MAGNPNANGNIQPEAIYAVTEAQVSCPICLDVLVNPVLLVHCGHTLCEQCCWNSFVGAGETVAGRALGNASFRRCPLCRVGQLLDPVQNVAIKDIADGYFVAVQGINPAAIAARAQIVQQHNQALPGLKQRVRDLMLKYDWRDGLFRRVAA